MSLGISLYKKLILISLVVIYIIFGVIVYALVQGGEISKRPSVYYSGYGDVEAAAEASPVNLIAAQDFINTKMMRSGHINLYVRGNNNSVIIDDGRTNSEAVSYYLLWNAQQGNKQDFDKELDFMNAKMLHKKGWLMWRLEADDSVVSDGSNVASDADLRAIKALILARDKWHDKKYDDYITRISNALEKVAVTNDLYLAPYGGLNNGKFWTANESWLSYSDFFVFKQLEEKDQKWGSIYENMKQAILLGQLENGLYNQELEENREYGNNLDDGAYSINSLWIMVRSAESGDTELRKSAQRALDFYKSKYSSDHEIFIAYNSSGDRLKNQTAPWTYALVARAAFALGDEGFADEMLYKLGNYQIKDKNSALYGAITEGSDNRVGQFTMQESILSAQEQLNIKEFDAS